MGVINRLISKDGSLSEQHINNRNRGHRISANRKVLFKQFNYEFRFKKYEPVAS